jgi:16S rRNA U516 pseudouridylate synthase RsuA-like enzyme
MKTRLNKLLARAGLTSRRGGDRLIADGRVTVEGRVVTEMGMLVDPAVDEVAVDGRPLPAAEPHEYIVLNKPAGYITTLSDPRGRPAVIHLLPDRRSRVYPVGRLDADVEGVLLLTNDGSLTHRLLHRPTQVELVRRRAGRTLLRLTFTEGRKHEIKRYCEALEHPVTRLRRVAFGPLTLGRLRPGQARSLTPRELRSLRSLA